MILISGPARINFLSAHGILGLALIAAAWPASWLQLQPLAEYSFFPLWLGYILFIDALVLRRMGTSLLVRDARAFLGLFVASVPLWWAFEGINYFTQNWHYFGADEYSTLRYFLVASWHFSIVIPAVFETAELAGSLGLVNRIPRGPVLPNSRVFPAGAMVVGLASLASLVLWPNYAFAGSWMCLLLLLDPINYLRGRPSILACLRRGDWRPVIALAVGALVCGWFWEMWNYWAFPKWQYTIPYVDFAHVFEMPLLGYGGYLPFGLEVYAAYHFLSGLSPRVPKVSLRLVAAIPETYSPARAVAPMASD